MEWRPDWGLRGRMVVTMFLLFALAVAFAAALVAFAGADLLVVATLLGSLSIVQLLFSHRLTLWSMDAREVSAAEYPELHATVTRLAQQADLPVPTVAVADTDVPNAFATGRSRDTAVVCVTTGLLDALDEDELAGVVAHELAHVRNRDMVVMTLASFLSTVAFIIVRWGWYVGGTGRSRNQAPLWVAILVSLVVWVVSFFLVRALSRYREYAADRGGALITGDPAALASALLTIDGRMDRVPTEDLRERAEMNAFFIVPIRAGVVGRFARTHPPTRDRVARLRDLARELETTGGRL